MLVLIPGEPFQLFYPQFSLQTNWLIAEAASSLDLLIAPSYLHHNSTILASALRLDSLHS